MQPSRILCLDFETYYDDVCSIKTLGTQGYFSHPDFEAYLITAAYVTPPALPNPSITFWASHPTDFDWNLIRDAHVVSHNAGFDETLYLFGCTKGWWPKIDYAQWDCTADLAAFLGLPRNLAGASEALLKTPVSKDTRTQMKHKRWHTMTKEFQTEVVKYAVKDAELGLKLWLAASEKWPEFEREVSRVNRRICQRGIPMNAAELRLQLQNLRKTQWDLEQAIPWRGSSPLLSRTAFNAECRKVGLEPPASLAKDNPEADEWTKQHADQFAWIAATSNWRRVNALVKKLEAFEASTGEDGRFYGNLQYFGAHTGRFSGSGGNLNLQNLPHGDLFGADLRKLIEAPKGRKLIKLDLSQIEVRTVCWLAGDFEMLEEIRNSDDVYETFAIRFGLWSPEQGRLAEKAPELRSKPVKPMVLGCGFGGGAGMVALKFGLDEEDARVAVKLYREKMAKVPELWARYDNGLATARMQLQPYEVKLPSGRVLRYPNLKVHREKYLAKVPVFENGQRALDSDGAPRFEMEERERMVTTTTRLMNSKRVRVPVWGGVITENAAQALARDVFTDRMLAMKQAGFEEFLILHIHDELVMEVPEARAEEIYEESRAIMSTSPSWIPDLPVAADGKILDVYTK